MMVPMYPINPTPDEAYEAGRLQGFAFASRRLTQDARWELLDEAETDLRNNPTEMNAGFVRGIIECINGASQ